MYIKQYAQKQVILKSMVNTFTQYFFGINNTYSYKYINSTPNSKLYQCTVTNKAFYLLYILLVVSHTLLYLTPANSMLLNSPSVSDFLRLPQDIFTIPGGDCPALSIRWTRLIIYISVQGGVKTKKITWFIRSQHTLTGWNVELRL